MKPRGFYNYDWMLAVAGLGIVLAIVIPNIVNFQERTRRRDNLKALHAAQVAFFQKNHRYAPTFAELDFKALPGSRMTCWLPKETYGEPNDSYLGLEPRADDRGFLVYCDAGGSLVRMDQSGEVETVKVKSYHGKYMPEPVAK